MLDDIIIRKGTIDEVVLLSKAINEFDNPYDSSVYEKRLKSRDFLILVAECQNQLLGFKVGYNKFQDGSFYTWMGGVVKEFRRTGVAKALANYQEAYAIKNGYNSIVLKTRNRHKSMLLFAINSGFEIIEVLTMESVEEQRIILKKQLN